VVGEQFAEHMNSIRVASGPLGSVVSIHADECVSLFNIRRAMVNAPNITLWTLRRLDDRLAAHFEGLTVAGDQGWRCCERALETPGSGELFMATVRALTDRDSERFEKMCVLAEGGTAAHSGVVAALEWSKPGLLQGVASALLSSDRGIRRRIGLAACAGHRVNPGQALTTAIVDEDSMLRARALSAVGELGERDLMPFCIRSINDEDGGCRCSASRSAVLLGDRDAAVKALGDLAAAVGPFAAAAFGLFLRVNGVGAGHEFLATVRQQPESERRVILGAGVVGDPKYVPWLIQRMADSKTARLAAEAFVNITGLKISQGFDTARPPAVEMSSSDELAGASGDLDPDEGLPWPDVQNIARWWEKERSNFRPGERYFLGQSVTTQHCIEVLKTGYQRHRLAAAEYLCLRNPGTPLFNTAAPGWRQQRVLAQMT